MAAIRENASQLTLEVESNELTCIFVEREANAVRLVFRSAAEAEEVESSLVAGGGLGMAVALPPVRVSLQ